MKTILSSIFWKKPALVGRLAKWQILLSEFDIQSMSQKSINGRAIADVLAKNPLKSNDWDKIDKRIHLVSHDKWTIYFDGAVKLSGSGSRAVLTSSTDQHYPVAAKLVFPCTNNISEYEACILGLQLAIDMKVKRL